MKRFTLLIDNGDTTKKIIVTSNEVEALVLAWEAKMQGKKVRVVNDDNLEILYR